MNKIISVAIPAILLIFCWTLLTSQALAWRVCNKTSYIIESATGVSSIQNVAIETSGWLRIRPGSCVTAQGTYAAGDHVWLYALSAPSHKQGRRVWGGNSRLCVDDRVFSINTQDACEAHGYRTAGFRQIELKNVDGVPTASLVEPSGFSLKKAREAGIQRLLRDLGLKVRSVDGNFGTHSVRLARGFKNEKNLVDMDIRSDAFIDELEKGLSEQNSKTGLILCNRAEAVIWTSLARQEKKKTWTSRGWWTLAPGECRKLLQKYPKSSDVYFYAEKGEVVEQLINTSESFCISESRFIIRDHDDCAASGYLMADFRLVDKPAGENAELQIINLTNADFEPVPNALITELRGSTP